MDNCILCGTNNWHSYGSLDKFKVVICRQCTLTKLAPTPSDQDLELFYKKHYRKQSNEEVVDQTVINYEQKRADRILPILKKHLPQKIEKTLDIGCSSGTLLSNISNIWGSTLQGIEFNEIYSNFILENKILDNNNLYNRPIEDLQETISNTDLITMVHVLEHVKNPLTSLQAINQVLSDDGFFYVEVPDIDTPYGKLLGNYFITYHLHYFSRTTLKQLLMKTGFEIVEEIKQAKTSIGFLCRKEKDMAPSLGAFYDFDRHIKNLDTYKRKYPFKNALVSTAKFLGIVKLKKALLG